MHNTVHVHVEDNSMSPTRAVEGPGAAAVSLVRSRRKSYVIETRTRRLNDLMFFVGWLEFFNALDFPANVFNERPVPAYAMGLMITGGVLIVGASCVAFWDLRKSWHNIKLLRRERAHLMAELARAEAQRGEEEAELCALHIKSWILVNRGELRWECIDRALMDGVGGLGGLLVGIGTLLAPAGADRHIFEASNLLSGYVGNGFMAFCGLLNAGWAAYLWHQGSQRWKAVERRVQDPLILKRARHCFENHQIYAAVYGVTVVVASAASLISATMWWGYVIMIPCVFASVFGNVLWRTRVGYDRVVFPYKPMLYQDIMDEIGCVIRMQRKIREGHHSALLAQYSRSQLLEFLGHQEMLEDLCMELTRHPTVTATLLPSSPDRIIWDQPALEAVEYTILARAAETCLANVGLRRAIDRERLLYELLGCYNGLEMEMFNAPERSGTEKSIMTRSTAGQSTLSVGTLMVN